jgi:Phosphotransferase enzyme family
MKGRVAGKEKSTKAPPFDETRLEDYLSQNIPGFSGPLTVQRFEPIEAMERLIEWLPKQLPPARATSLVHGDLQLDNMIFSSASTACRRAVGLRTVDARRRTAAGLFEVA